MKTIKEVRRKLKQSEGKKITLITEYFKGGICTDSDKAVFKIVWCRYDSMRVKGDYECIIPLPKSYNFLADSCHKSYRKIGRSCTVDGVYKIETVYFSEEV